MTTEHSLVSIIDDDVSVREALPDLVKELGYAVEAFASAEEFLASGSMSRTDCLLLDLAMPGMSGVDLHCVLTLQGKNIPIIYITGCRDTKAHASVLKRGAVDCLYKPFSDGALIHALNAALHVSQAIH